MIVRTLSPWVLLAASCGACSRVGAPRVATPRDPASSEVAPAPDTASSAPRARASVLEPGAVRLPRVPSVASGTTGLGSTAAPTAPARGNASEPAVQIAVHAVAASEGEDGAGNTVPASHPVAIDLERPEGWPGGALATTLYVGALHFHNVGYPGITTMRFVVADGAALPTDADVVLQYGSHPDTQRVLAHSLAVPQ